jgi:hypothetical protein
MPITSDDIKFLGSDVMAEDDSTVNQGGVIDTTVKMLFTDISTTDNVTIISSSAGDTTQTVTVYGRDASGALINEALSLNGTSRVVGSELFERILKVVVSASHAGTITVTRDNGPTYTTIGTLETGILSIRRPFYNVAADVTGGSSRNFYEKIFIKNTHGTLALLSAVIKELSDPTGNITFDLEDAVDGNNSSSDRVTAPASAMLGSFDDTNKNVPGTNLEAGTAIGVWLNLTLSAGATPQKSTYAIRVDGITT